MNASNCTDPEQMHEYIAAAIEFIEFLNRVVDLQRYL